ncbi:MAG: ABC transporter substrate-binding protein, partial [Roseburia sp.]|nr:ABC transporter substrate-binding protein [Roseburia sp.]
MKRFIRKILSLALVAAMALTMAGCGDSGTGTATQEDIVNIGITDSLGGINPLTVDQTWVNKYAIGLQFLPLVDLDNDLNFVPMLA